MKLIEKIKSFFIEDRATFEEILGKGAVLIDVRTPAEFKAGHHKKSKNYPLQSLSSQLSKLKGKEVILVCRSGARAKMAKKILTNAGITAHNAGAWQNLN